MKIESQTNLKLIAILGGSGAGKTWLAGRLQRSFGKQAIRLTQDDFYRDLGHLSVEARDRVNFDHPRAIDWAAFETVLRDCREGRITRVPQYNFTTHTRLPEHKLLIPAPLVLVEGLWLLWRPELHDLFDFKIYLECPAQLRLERRLARDVIERGRSPDSVREQFWKHVAPMHELHVAPQSKWADFVMPQPPDETDLRKLVEILQPEKIETRAPETIPAPHDENHEDHYEQAA